jgi:hypothetical protein
MASLDGTIKEGQSDVAASKDFFGSMGDKGSMADDSMGVNPGGAVTQKKRGIDDDAEETSMKDSTKHFFINKHRVDGAVKQVGGKFEAWIQSVPIEQHHYEVSRHLEYELTELTPEQQLEINCLPHEDQIPRLAAMFAAKQIQE